MPSRGELGAHIDYVALYARECGRLDDMNDREGDGRAGRQRFILPRTASGYECDAASNKGFDLAIGDRTRRAGGAVGAVGAQVLAGGLVATTGSSVLAGMVALLGVLLLVLAPSWALVAVLPASMGYWRVGPASSSLSVADVALGAAFVAALPYVDWRSARLRSFLRLLGLYLGILSIAVVANLSTRSAFEWGHRAFLVGCALAVGVALERRANTVWALRFFVLTGLVLAVVAAIDTVGAEWIDGLPAPAYPFGLQKNPAALLIAIAALVVIVAPTEVRLPRFGRLPCIVVLLVGIAACQSRGTAIALAAVLSFWLLRTGRLLRSPLTLAGIALMIAMAYLSFSALFQSDAADSRFNSVNFRLETYDRAVSLWSEGPLTGAGLKYWRDADVNARFEGGAGEPHNLIVAALGDSGVLGLLGLVVLVGGAALLLRRGHSEVVTLAWAVLLAKALASCFDIFWVAGTMTVPWIIVGVACARSSPPTPHAFARDRSPDRDQPVAVRGTGRQP
jgi:hypothetical protein